MKIVLDKKSFTMDEGGLIKDFKAQWQESLNPETVKSAALDVAKRCGLDATELVQIGDVELTKNNHRPTYWVNTLVRGEGFYAELSFDLIDVFQASSEEKTQAIKKIFREEK